jgi:mono/diheme cytochrome c family protein
MCGRLVVLAAVMIVVFGAGCGDGATGDVAPSPSPRGGQVAEGEAIFTEHCAGCHTLADAGTTGAVGPNLDQSKPPKALVVERVTNGKGAMPAFTGRFSGGHFLTDAQVQAVADYVSSATGG